jgi:hypothetical protein
MRKSDILFFGLILVCIGLFGYILYFLTNESGQCLKNPYIYGAKKMGNVDCSCTKEIGICPEQISIVKAFSELYIPPSNFTVIPFLGYSHDELIFKPDPREVFGIIELSLIDFLDENNFTTQIMETSYMKEVELPVFKFGDKIVWGATGMMLSELKEVLKKVV